MFCTLLSPIFLASLYKPPERALGASPVITVLLVTAIAVVILWGIWKKA
jgi:hypothetical protein